MAWEKKLQVRQKPEQTVREKQPVWTRKATAYVAMAIQWSV